MRGDVQGQCGGSSCGVVILYVNFTSMDVVIVYVNFTSMDIVEEEKCLAKNQKLDYSADGILWLVEGIANETFVLMSISCKILQQIRTMYWKLGRR